MKIKWIACGVSLLLIGIVVSSIVIRQHRYSGDLRICSTIGAFHFDYERNHLMFDDGILADQAFGMQKCAKDVDIRDCSLSIISFVNPDKVKPEDVDFDFEVKRSDKNTIVEIKNLEMDKNIRGTSQLIFKDGSFVSVTTDVGGKPMTFRKCHFPLFR